MTTMNPTVTATAATEEENVSRNLESKEGVAGSSQERDTQEPVTNGGERAKTFAVKDEDSNPNDDNRPEQAPPMSAVLMARMEREKSNSINSHNGEDNDNDNSSMGTDIFAEDDPNNKEQETQEPVAGNKRHDKAVLFLRILVLLVLMGAAVVVSTMVYRYLDDAEQTAFEEQFDSDAAKVIEEMGKTLDNTLGPVDSLAVNLVAYSRTVPKRMPNQNNTSFPFVIMPSFGLQATKMLRNSKGFNTYFAPKVTPQQTKEWSVFVNETHREWIEQALDIADGDPDYEGLIYRNYSQRTCLDMFIWGGQVVPIPRPDIGFHLPKVMEYPVVSGAGRGRGCPYNFDMAYSAPMMNLVIDILQKERKGVIGSFINVNYNRSDPQQELQYQGTTAFYRTLLSKDEDPTEPATNILMPVFDVVDKVYQRQSASPETFVGFFAITIQFKAWIRNILPENSNGIIVVVEQSCGVSPGTTGTPFTYRIDGASAIYLGVGDQHDPKYDNMVRTQVLQALTDPTLVDRGTTYTGMPMSDFCPSTIKIYPSQDMEDNHRTNTPLVMTIVAASIFAFTSLIFLGYDAMVTLRQKNVLKRALESGAIVSSLFPQEVVEKLYEENKAKFQKEEKKRNFINEGSRHHSTASDTTVADSNQIAKLYPECTIFFGDLAGFTKWSSQREPPDVFKLLETLYGAFDKIADRRSVCKIETIGDCYVAITGCPKPQTKHAEIMCRFARDCMTEMRRITTELAETLGDDTAELGLRIGLHSGSTTAGVLRGAKARFQIFGDTVNTAARMESNGEPGRIHVSEFTAELLRRGGKDRWLETRENKIVAKGKGSMQTYWVNPTNSAETKSIESMNSGMLSLSGRSGTDMVEESTHRDESARDQPE